MRESYIVRRVSPPAAGAMDLSDPLWSGTQELEISHFHPKSSDHRPRTRVRMLHDLASLHIRFEVNDRYVICKHTSFQDSVYQDSCVEFFFQPLKGPAYFNLEINCGGTFLFYYVQDSTRTPTGLAKFTPIAPHHAKRLSVFHSLPSIVTPGAPIQLPGASPAQYRWRCWNTTPARSPLSLNRPGVAISTNALTKAPILIGRVGRRWERNSISIYPNVSEPCNLNENPLALRNT